jgi:hypothetical protein
MPDLRDLLHDAAPRASRDVDLDAVRARARQRTRRRRALVGGVAALVVLAIGVTAAAVAASDDDTHRRIDVVDVPTTTTVPDVRAPHLEVVTELPSSFGVHALAATGDDLWIAGLDQTDGWVLRRQSASSAAFSTTSLPGAVRDIVVDDDRLWLWGGGDGGEPVGGVGVVDATTGTLVDTFGWIRHAPQYEPMSTYDLAVLDGDAWVSDATGDRVFRLRLLGDRIEATPVPTGTQPTDVVTTDDGEVWVVESQDRTIARIDPRTMTVAERNDWRGGLLAWDRSTRTVWSNTDGWVQELIGFRTGDPQHTLPHAAVLDLITDPTTVWVREHGGVTRYERTWPDTGLHPVEQAIGPLPVIDLFPTAAGGPAYLASGRQILRWDPDS